MHPKAHSVNLPASGASARAAEFAAELAGVLAATCVAAGCVIEQSDATEAEVAGTCIKEFGEFRKFGEFREFKDKFNFLRILQTL